MNCLRKIILNGKKRLLLAPFGYDQSLNRSMSTHLKRPPSRIDVINKLINSQDSKYDLVVIGGGCAGAGAALDAATRGLKVACLEREDYGSGTSSRSTKLLWGGSRYLVQAMVSLFSFGSLRNPKTAVKSFLADFKMVLNCHKERKFLLEKQSHLTSWLPIAVPMKSWIQWPPPFQYPPAALGPLGIYPIFFKFYDALSGFSCPPSHVMTRFRSARKFPQLDNSAIKYSCVFYEGQHDDARTNLAIALTAEEHGADMLNYCEVVRLIREKDISSTNSTSDKVCAAVLRDTISKEEFTVHSKSFLLCGGPFTDALRQLEDPLAQKVVTGASGVHIVLPSYCAPTGIGLVDMSTSDGRFLFFLPWQGCVLVGTTDVQCDPNNNRPEPSEKEIRWLLKEASKYLSPEMKLRRKDVLSAWSGIRPLALDPHATEASGATSKASRDHIVSHNPATGVVFVTGGKWTTYREMAEDAVTKIVEVNGLLHATKCRTLEVDLVGKEGFTTMLPVRLIQQYNISAQVAARLSTAYGGRAHDVLRIAVELQKAADSAQDSLHSREGLGLHPSHAWRRTALDALLVPGHPYIEAEVIFAVRAEHACHAEDIIARRTRLAFLNKEAAIAALPRIVELMGNELNWTPETQCFEVLRGLSFLKQFGGPVSEVSSAARYRTISIRDLMHVFRLLGMQGNTTAIDVNEWTVDRAGIKLAAELLGNPLTDESIEDCLNYSRIHTGQKQDTSVVSLHIFADWWNADHSKSADTYEYDPVADNVFTIGAQLEHIKGSGTIFG